MMSCNRGERLAHVLIRHLPTPNLCVLGFGRRSQCVIRHMPMRAPYRSEAGFAGNRGRFHRMEPVAYVDLMRFCGRITHSRAVEVQRPEAGRVLRPARRLSRYLPLYDYWRTTAVRPPQAARPWRTQCGSSPGIVERKVARETPRRAQNSDCFRPLNFHGP